MNDGGASWAEFEEADGELAARVLARLEDHRHVVLATLRADGAPRLSGMEAPVRSGHLWLGMSPESVKVSDLRRDARFSLHSAPDDEHLPDGDARIDGIATPADAAQQADFVAGHRHPIEDPSKMALFTALIQRVVLVHVADDQLLIDSWTPEGGRSTQSSH